MLGQGKVLEHRLIRPCAVWTWMDILWLLSLRQMSPATFSPMILANCKHADMCTHMCMWMHACVHRCALCLITAPDELGAEGERNLSCCLLDGLAETLTLSGGPK